MNSFETLPSSSNPEEPTPLQKPGFLRTFSKETAKEERKELADNIKRLRNEARSSESPTNEESLLLSLENLDTNAERQTADELEALPHLNNLNVEALHPNQEGKKDVRSAIKEELNNFWVNEASRWIEQGYDPEKIKELFTEDHLSSLSMEEYVLLLKRFPANMATHVTRQGVRDHFEGQHNVGEGEFHNGLIDILETGRLHSSLSKYLVQEDKVSAVGEFLKAEMAVGHANTNNAFSDAEIAQATVDTFDRKPHFDAGSVSDQISVHFGLEAVLNRFYGAETGNEAFFIYPTAHIFSQFPFDRNGPASDDFSNDLWVFTEKEGLSANAGILFLPKSTPVDPENGSRYKVVEGKVEENESTLTMLQSLVENPEFPTLLQDLKLASEGEKDIRQVIGRLENDFGIDDAEIEYAFTNPSLVEFIQDKMKSQSSLASSFAKQIAQRGGVLYKRPAETINSQEYWEAFFAANPALKPKKVVYYDGEPTQAVEEWRNANGLAPSPRLQARMAGIDFVDNSLTGPKFEEYEQDFDRQKKDFIVIAKQALARIQ